jgi:transposase InsO family protein
LPGDFIADRPVNSFNQPAGLPTATPHQEVLQRPHESAQFVALAFGQKARAARIAQSMGSRGDCWDNAVAESFFATLKKELIHRRSWPSKNELRLELFDYIEAFYQHATQTLHQRRTLPGPVRKDLHHQRPKS